MSITDREQVDAIGIAALGGEVVLTVSDHLDWSEPLEHLMALQDKLNCYLAFDENGELLSKYPAAQNRPVIFQIVGKFPLAPEGSAFIERIRPVLSQAGVELRLADLDRLAADRPS